MKASFNKLYRQLTLIFCVFLFITALTGIIYGLHDRFFQLPTLIANILIAIHQGAFLGKKIAPLYVLSLGLSVFAIGLTVLINFRDKLIFSQTQPNTVNAYRLLLLVVGIPLALCVEAGVAYRLGTDWFGLSERQTAVFLAFHGGSVFGTFLGIFYTLTVGLVLIAISIAGFKIGMTSVLSRRTKQTDFQQQFQQQLKTPHLLGDNLLQSLAGLRQKARLAIILFSILFIGIFYYATSELLVSIVIIGIFFVLPALILASKLIMNWQHQQEIQARFYERETESITILKAIPDSILRISKDGICLSYMPAKGAKSFVLYGDIINKHVTEFLPLEIANGFIGFARLSLQTGHTHVYRFSISLDKDKQYHEARITSIGETEVLIVVREISNLNEALTLSDKQILDSEDSGLKLLTEPELIQVLEKIVKNIQQDPKNHILFCLAIDEEVNNNDVPSIDDNLIHQIAAKTRSCLASNTIARFDNNDLIILVTNCTMKNASILVNNLNCSLDEFFSTLPNKEQAIDFSIGLLEINADVADTNSLISAVRATYVLARQKVNFKPFW
jgi:GGDEF domain-containing protein